MYFSSSLSAKLNLKKTGLHVPIFSAAQGFQSLPQIRLHHLHKSQSATDTTPESSALEPIRQQKQSYQRYSKYGNFSSRAFLLGSFLLVGASCSACEALDEDKNCQHCSNVDGCKENYPASNSKLKNSHSTSSCSEGEAENSSTAKSWPIKYASLYSKHPRAEIYNARRHPTTHLDGQSDGRNTADKRKIEHAVKRSTNILRKKMAISGVNGASIAVAVNGHLVWTQGEYCQICTHFQLDLPSNCQCSKIKNLMLLI